MRRWVLAGVVVALLAMSAPANAAGAMAPERARVMGRSYAAWAQTWGRWAFGDASNPLIASLETGDCGDVVGDVFLMVAPIAEGVELECHVPVGTPIVVTHAGTFGWSPDDGEDDASLEATVRGNFALDASELVLDGRSLRLFTTSSGAFDVVAETGSFFESVFGLGTGTIRTAITGQFAVILPLAPGAHDLDASVAFSNGDAFSATYHIVVG